MSIPTNQQKSLANIHYKSRFIWMFCKEFAADNFLVKQANNDADAIIEQFNGTNITIVVGEEEDFINNTDCTNSK